MGEAKRRKKLDPSFGLPKPKLITESLENSDSLEDDDFYEDDDSFEDDDFYEDDDTDNENNLRITLCFDFEIQAVTIDNRQVSQFGQIERFKMISSYSRIILPLVIIATSKPKYTLI